MRKGNGTLIAVLFLAAICGLLFLFQVAYSGCERGQRAITTELRKKEIEREARLPIEEQKRIKAERDRVYREKHPARDQIDRERDEYLRLKEIYGDQ